MNPTSAEHIIAAHKPLSPSIMLNALMIPVTQNIVKGIPQAPTL